MSYNFTNDTTSFYIHWPFCPYECDSCPLVTQNRDAIMARYYNALQNEIEQFCLQYAGGKKLLVKTLYVGGGIPSYTPLQGGLDIGGILSKSFDFKSSLEVSVEVSPGTIRCEQLEAWKACGVNRISFGVHKLKDTVLQSCIRLDDSQSKQFSYLFSSVAEYFENISVDLLLGMPDISFDAWKMVVQRLVAQPITHISVYFADDNDTYPHALDDEMIISLYEWTSDFLQAHGFERYELSNFCKPGFESKHHEMYWDHEPYKGFGLGACSFDGATRFQNETDIMRYCEGVEHRNNIMMAQDTLTSEQLYLERLMLGLRRKNGVARSVVLMDCSKEVREQRQKTIQLLLEEGFLHERDGNLMLTSVGLMLESEIITQLIR